MKKRSFLDVFGQEKALRLIAQSTLAAAQKALDAGLPVTVMRAGVLYRRYPDGYIERR